MSNANTIAFGLGLALLTGGVGMWSAPAAAIVCGAVLMVVAAWPYLRAGRKV